MLNIACNVTPFTRRIAGNNIIELLKYSLLRLKTTTQLN